MLKIKLFILCVSVLFVGHIQANPVTDCKMLFADMKPKDDYYSWKQNIMFLCPTGQYYIAVMDKDIEPVYVEYAKRPLCADNKISASCKLDNVYYSQPERQIIFPSK